MLNRLRWQLTFVYLLAAVSLVGLVSFGAYSLLRYYFERETDLALQYKMAVAYQQYGLALPVELAQAERQWQAGKNTPLAPPTSTRQVAKPAASSGDDEHEKEGESGSSVSSASNAHSGEEDDDRYNAQLASIFVLPIDAQGQVIAAPGTALPPFAQDQAASQSALLQGSDLRTSHAGGIPIRLLTYRIDSPNGPLLLQVGRSLEDQARVLQQFLLGLVFLGAVSSLVLGIASWGLAGKSLGPAQRSWDQQQAFVSNASHELRTPLTLVKATAEVGLRRRPDDEQKQYLEDILGEVDYMNHLVDDLLLLSRLDARRLDLSPGPVPLPELLAEAAQQARKLAAEKQIDLQVGTSQGTARGDRTRLRQVLLILLDNAVRFTPNGGVIRLAAACKRKACQIVVGDTGPGIAPEHLPHIFERFYQANPTGEGAARSNGLGLSIAKGMIELQGGEISVQSRPGEGSRFVIELPLWES